MAAMPIQTRLSKSPLDAAEYLRRGQQDIRTIKSHVLR
jgi:hypothetical protein